MGGGAGNTTSLLELLELIEQIHGSRPPVQFDSWRPGDQRYYVSDIRKFAAATGWAPQVTVRQGVKNLYQWLLETPGLSTAALVAGRKR